jgi:UDP-3-O-[3-hydroxymyristoyl] glucosamine N-acyltransferase
MVGELRLADIVAALGGELQGDGSIPIDRIGSLDSATSTTLSFIANRRFRAQLATTRAGALIVAPELRSDAAARGPVVVTPDPYLYYARLTQWWVARARAPIATGVHPSAHVDEGATLGAGVHVGPFAVIERGAAINDGAVVGPHCIVGRDARVGAYTRLVARVTLAEACAIGARGIVHPGAVIGADGFGFAPHDGRWEKIEQLGSVAIGDDVEIGANTCIDRGALDDTVIADGVKLDNLIQIGHNVRVGAHTAMAGCVGVAGSAVIGAHCTVGGGAVILGHLTIADHVHVSAATVITRSIAKPGHYSGVFPFDDNAAWEKNAATLRQLHGLRERLRDLENKR